MARKTKTSTKVKNRWNAKTYNRYVALLRKEDDRELIDFIEKHKGVYSIGDYIRQGLKYYMEKEK